MKYGCRLSVEILQSLRGRGFESHLYHQMLTMFIKYVDKSLKNMFCLF